MDEARLVRKVLLNCEKPKESLYGDIPKLPKVVVEKAVQIAGQEKVEDTLAIATLLTSLWRHRRTIAATTATIYVVVLICLESNSLLALSLSVLRYRNKVITYSVKSIYSNMRLL